MPNPLNDQATALVKLMSRGAASIPIHTRSYIMDTGTITRKVGITNFDQPMLTALGDIISGLKVGGYFYYQFTLIHDNTVKLIIDCKPGTAALLAGQKAVVKMILNHVKLIIKSPLELTEQSINQMSTNIESLTHLYGCNVNSHTTRAAFGDFVAETSLINRWCRNHRIVIGNKTVSLVSNDHGYTMTIAQAIGQQQSYYVMGNQVFTDYTEFMMVCELQGLQFHSVPQWASLDQEVCIGGFGHVPIGL